VNYYCFVSFLHYLFYILTNWAVFLIYVYRIPPLTRCRPRSNVWEESSAC
jgi:hypothetical protein